MQAGAFVPEVVLDHPEDVRQLHREFVHAGSDVVEALTYYAHREKLRVIGKEALLETMNRQALEIAREVAAENNALLAGDLSNTNVYLPNDTASKEVRAMFDEQVGWAVDAGVDFIIAETFSYTAEAILAVEAIKATGLPAVVTMAIHREGMTLEGWTPAEACKRLEEAGADVVGLNCARGPETLLPLLKPIRDAVSCHVAALPVPYRTKERSRPSSLSPNLLTLICPVVDPSPLRWIHSHAIAMRLPRSPARPTSWVSITLAYAAAQARTTSVAWLRRSVAPLRLAVIQPICPSMPSLALTAHTQRISGSCLQAVGWRCLFALYSYTPVGMACRRVQWREEQLMSTQGGAHDYYCC